MISYMTDSFECWLWDKPADTFSGLKEALQGWVEDHSDGGGICSTGGNYAAFLQVVVFEFARAAHDHDAFGDVLPGKALDGQHPKAYILQKDAELLDERWYQHAVMLYQRYVGGIARHKSRD